MTDSTNIPAQHTVRSARDVHDGVDREEELAQLRSAMNELVRNGEPTRAVETLLELVAKMQRDNDRLRNRVMAAMRARYGRSSEKLNAERLGQLVLALGGTDEQASQQDPSVPAPQVPAEDVDADEQNNGKAQKTKKGKKRRPNHPGRTKLDPSLPRNVTLVPASKEEKTCVHCHGEMDVIGYVDHETVVYVPARIEVNVERREKRACKKGSCGQGIDVAGRSKTNVLSRRVDVSLLAELVESKLDDALPVYRQRDRLSRLGFDVPLNTLYGYWTHGLELLAPVGEVTLSAVLGDPIVGVDDTRLDYLDPEAPKRKRRGHLWCFVGSSGLIGYTFTLSWKAEDIFPYLKAIDGFIQCDDYKGYDSQLEDDEGNLVRLVPHDSRLGCLMHVRRRFRKALDAGDLRAALPLKLIADIYEVERRATAEQLDPSGRLALRQAEAIPLVDELDQWVDQHRPKLLPTSKLGRAAGYAEAQRVYVRRCFSDGRFDLDTGRVERAIKEPAIGRKNYLFSGSADAAARMAGGYSLVQSCRAIGAPVREYLVDVMTKVASGWKARRINELRPDRWLQARQH